MLAHQLGGKTSISRLQRVDDTTMLLNQLDCVMTFNCSSGSISQAITIVSVWLQVRRCGGHAEKTSTVDLKKEDALRHPVCKMSMVYSPHQQQNITRIVRQNLASSLFEGVTQTNRMPHKSSHANTDGTI